MKRRQRGMATVEFALVATVLLAIMLGAIEVGRLLYVWNVLGEAARRGARVAAVCPPGDSRIRDIAVFNVRDGGGSTPLLSGFGPGNVAVSYLNAAGTPGATGLTIQYVSVTVAGYVHNFIIPLTFLTGGGASTITVPPFTTTLPRESLGFVPISNGSTCF